MLNSFNLVSLFDYLSPCFLNFSIRHSEFTLSFESAHPSWYH